MDIEEDRQSDRIDFDEVQSELKSDYDQSEKKSEVEFYNNKKTKADKIITCLPQPGLTSATNSFEGQKFLFVNQFGCVVQRL